MRTTLATMMLGAMLGSAWAMPQAGSVEAAMPLAKEQGRDIMLEFTGKEWCPPCIHLRAKILETAAAELTRYLATPELEPELAQIAWRALGDTYAFQRRYKDVYAAYKKAYEAAPDSRLAPRLQDAVQHYERNILPAVERGEL